MKSSGRVSLRRFLLVTGSRRCGVSVPATALIALVILRGLSAGVQEPALAASEFATLSAQADRARDANRLDDAVLLYRRALALQPNWREGWWSLGTVEYDRSAYRDAGKAFARVIALDPNAGTAKVMLGLCEFEQGQDLSALRHLEEGRQIGVADDPQLRHVMLYHIGVLQQRRGNFESAHEALAALCRDSIRNDDLTRELGMVALRVPGSRPAAKGTPEATIIAGLGRAECLAAQDKFDEARREYAELVKAYPQYPNIHYAYGKLLLSAHDAAAAVTEFQREILNYPDHVFARLEIAAAKYRVDSPGGLPYAEEAVRLNPKLAFTHYLLGLLLLDTRNYQQAIRELEIARRASPRQAPIYFALASAYAHVGRKQEAAQARAIFVRLKRPNSPSLSAHTSGGGRDGTGAGRLGPGGDSEPLQ